MEEGYWVNYERILDILKELDMVLGIDLTVNYIRQAMMNHKTTCT